MREKFEKVLLESDMLLYTLVGCGSDTDMVLEGEQLSYVNRCIAILEAEAVNNFDPLAKKTSDELSKMLVKVKSAKQVVTVLHFINILCAMAAVGEAFEGNYLGIAINVASSILLTMITKKQKAQNSEQKEETLAWMDLKIEELERSIASGQGNVQAQLLLKNHLIETRAKLYISK